MLKQMDDLMKSGKKYIRDGDIMICSTDIQQIGIGTQPKTGETSGITNARGSSYYGTARFSNSSNGRDLVQAGFPVCFTSPPTLYVVFTGSSKAASLSKVGQALAENAGPSSITVWNDSKFTVPNGLSARFMAVGECCGDRQLGAAVITEVLRYLGKAEVDGVPIREYIIRKYNSFVEAGDGNKQEVDSQWCSEFACTCDRLAGIPKEVAPMFASAYSGSRKYSALGRWYKRDGSGFRQATVTDGHSDTWSDKFISKEIVMPQVGDLLWMCNKAHPNMPWHTARVTSVDGTKIYTIEGNLGDRVERRCRDISKDSGLGKWVYAFGRVDYSELK